MARIDSVDGRARLKARDEPYWARIAAGCYLGFRKLTPSSTGTWVARFRNADDGLRSKRSLGDLVELPAAKRYDAAKKEAEAWFKHLGVGGSTVPVTVRAACAQYVQFIRDARGDAAADEIAARFKRWVDQSPFANVDLAKLTRARVESWRSILTKTPARQEQTGEHRKVCPRTLGTVNRDMTALRAALNRAYDAGHVSSDIAWRVALRPNKNVDRPRSGYLNLDQRRELVRVAPKDLAAFLRALSLLPLRPGALAALTVGNFDKTLGVLTIGRDKAGHDRKIKLPDTTAALLAEAGKRKLPSTPLLTRANGKAWDKDAWKWPIKAAATAAKLPSSTTAYVLRHSVITDLVVGGLDLATTAVLSGTSVAMIERHYMHLQADRAATALAGLAL